MCLAILILLVCTPTTHLAHLWWWPCPPGFKVSGSESTMPCSPISPSFTRHYRRFSCMWVPLGQRSQPWCCRCAAACLLLGRWAVAWFNRHSAEGLNLHFRTLFFNQCGSSWNLLRLCWGKYPFELHFPGPVGYPAEDPWFPPVDPCVSPFWQERKAPWCWPEWAVQLPRPPPLRGVCVVVPFVWQPGKLYPTQSPVVILYSPWPLLVPEGSVLSGFLPWLSSTFWHCDEHKGVSPLMDSRVERF